jgi:predicted RNase H-like nuclease (RuvC/YqgF family)
MTSDKKQAIPIECYSVKKKSRYDAKHRIKDSSKIQKYIKCLEDKIDILEDDLIELKWEIDDIKKNLSQTKSKSKKKVKVTLDSNSSDNESEYNSSDIEEVCYTH